MITSSVVNSTASGTTVVNELLPEACQHIRFGVLKGGLHRRWRRAGLSPSGLPQEVSRAIGLADLAVHATGREVADQQLKKIRFG
jgi:hypothetical protein